MGTMYDSDTAADIPRDAQIVAGYIDGEGPWTDADWALFPDAAHVTITRANPATAGARVADGEAGALSPAEVAQWAKEELAAGRRPTIYRDKSTWTDQIKALSAIGVGQNSVDWWIAGWTGEAYLLPGTVATQYANPDTSGGHYDLSETAPGWPAAEPAPAPPAPPPAPPAPSPGGGDVQLPQLQEGSTGDSVKTWQSILNGRGQAGLAIDGIFGPKTKYETQKWQEVFQLSIDGIVGPITWSSAFA